MFKKIFSAIALAATLTACTGDYKDWDAPHVTPQADAVAFGNGSISEVGLIDFANIADGQQTVKVCNIVAPTASDEAYAPEYKITLDGTDYALAADGSMSVPELISHVESNFGKAPYERELSAVVSMWLNNGKTTIKTVSSGAFAVKAKLNAPTLYPHLYLIGAPSQWDPTCTSMPFKHNDAVSVYDDPVFTITFDFPEGDTWFAFADDHTVETGDRSQVFGALEGNGNNKVGEVGFFTRRADLSDDGSFMIHVEGDAKFVNMTVNVLEGTYLIEKVNFAEYIYLPGNAQGWNPETAAALKGDGAGKYTGFAVMDGDFKFTQQRAWAAEYNNGSFFTCSDCFDLGDQGGGDIAFTGTPGLYFFEVDVVAGDLKATRIDNMNLVGDFNGWNAADDAQQMTWNAAELCFEKTGCGVTAAGWKFTANNDWGINLGGTVDNLVANGDNLDAVGSTIKLYPCRTTSNNIYCTVE